MCMAHLKALLQIQKKLQNGEQNNYKQKYIQVGDGFVDQKGTSSIPNMNFCVSVHR